MARIIQPRHIHTSVEFRREFRWNDGTTAGFCFPCDEDGNVDESKIQPLALENYRKCLNGEHDVTDRGVLRFEHSYREPAVLECDCGEHVCLDGFTNTCDRCGADYNMSGQRLAPRSQWGKETGEHWTECY